MSEPSKPGESEKVLEEKAKTMAEPSRKSRLEKLFADLGKIGIITYFVIFLGTWATFAVLITSGFEVDGAAGGAGTIGAAWVATKVTQPIRIGATVVLAPLITAAWNKLRPPKGGLPADDAK